jgi:YHS domain-containing protein
MKKTFAIITGIIALIACNDKPKLEAKVANKEDTIITTKTTDFKSITIDYKKDPVCGMPITAGIEDTLLYKGKIIAFCSKECKTSFIDKPSSFTLTSK